ncbi:MAG TPA: GNAT family N-acetyltransferase [Burkholderiales bacterium]|nr:GNAT family N-acetyltransferase [Burkholderiales bacterium]
MGQMLESTLACLSEKLARQPPLSYRLQMKYPVVPIAEGYIESFREALDAVTRERRYLAMLEAPPLQEVRRFVRENIREGRPSFVALDAARVIGWCDILSLNRPVYAHAGVLGIGVLNGYREQGVGQALMHAALVAAKGASLTRVELTVREHNVRAKRLYEKMGFVVEGVKRRGVHLDGIYEDLICMAKLLE